VPEWDAELAIDETLVRALLTEQFPELDAGSARRLAEGWDNSVWVVEDEWAFRFPRREIAVPGVVRELEYLPLLAPLLSVLLPVPTHVGKPNERFPWPWFGCPLLPGVEAAEADLTDAARVGLGRELGRFLSRLHTPATLDQVDPEGALPADPNQRADMPARVRIARRWLAELESLGSWRAPDNVGRLFGLALELPPSHTEAAVVHGDLHVRHVLVIGGALSGVIDWGDICRADPAVDLGLFWSLLQPAGREAFLTEYGPVEEEQALRARVLAIALCAALAVYGRREGYPSLEQGCVAGLERTLVE
jgi:aminoglycoside phosphotransferase (APT) family kinase protein